MARTAPRRHLTVGFVLTACLLGCAAPPDAPIDPGSARPADLEGYWVAREQLPGSSPTQIIFGFSSNARARQILPWDRYGLTPPESAPVSVVYMNIGRALSIDEQYATYDVAGGSILQTVIADVRSLPGTMYSTRIFELRPRTSMTIESQRDPSGRRTYEWFSHCPVPNQMGWDHYRGHTEECPPGTLFGNSIAFDAEGGVHHVSGVSPASGCPSMYAYVSEACVPAHQPLPQVRWSAIHASGDEVLLAISTLDEQLILLRRAHDEPRFREPERIDPELPGTVHGIRFLEGAPRPTLLWTGLMLDGRTRGGYVYTLEADGTWSRRGGADAPFPYATSTGTAEGHVLFVRDRALHRVDANDAAVGEPLPLGFSDVRWASPPFVRPNGRVQVAVYGTLEGDRTITQLYFLEWDGSAWSRTPLGPSAMGWIATHGDGPSRIAVRLPNGLLALHTLEGGRIAESELSGMGVGTDAYIAPAAVVGPAGEIAYTSEGYYIAVRRRPPIDRERATVRVVYPSASAAVRVRSSDGRIDCTSDCEVAAEMGERIPVTFEPSPGWTVTVDECRDSFVGDARDCVVDVSQPEMTLTVRGERTAVQRQLSAAGPGLRSAASMFAVNGERVVLQAEFVEGALELTVGSTDLTNASFTPRALVGYHRGTGDAWMVRIPVAPLALGAPDDGGAWMLAEVTSSTDFGGRIVGESGTTSVVRVRFDAAGAVQGAEVIASGPSTTFGSVRAAAMASDGTAVLVTSQRTGAATFWRAPPTGAAASVALPISDFGLPVRVRLDGMRAVVMSNANGLAVINGTTVAGTRTFGEASIRELSLRGDRVVALISNPSGSVDLGAGVRTTRELIVQYDGTLRHLADRPLPELLTTGGRLTALGAVADGAVVALGEYVWRYDLALDLVVEPVFFMNTTPTLQTGTDDDSLLVLYPGSLVELRP
jgi:hypothetical protein